MNKWKAKGMYPEIADKREFEYGLTDLEELCLLMRVIRMGKGISLEDLGESLDLNPNNISKIEQGRTKNLPIDKVDMIFKELGYKVNIKVEKI